MPEASTQGLGSTVLDLTAPLVIFDGVCGLCNRSVDFIIRHDAAEQFLFAPSQTAAVKPLLEDHGLDSSDVDTIYLYENGVLYDRSDAVLRIAAGLPFPFRIAAAARLLPRPLRDLAYKAVAKRRYRWFGKSETCRLPTPAERARFIE